MDNSNGQLHECIKAEMYSDEVSGESNGQQQHCTNKCEDVSMKEELNTDETPLNENKGDVFSAPSDPLAYVNKIHTNEMWKLHVSQIPRYVGYQAFRKKMAHLGLTPSKIKLLGKRSDCYAFLVFKSKDDMEHGYEVLNDLKWKSCSLQVKYGKPSADPYVKKNQDYKKNAVSEVKPTEVNETFEKLKEILTMESEEEKAQELGKLLCSITEPWCEVEYSEQLARKMTTMKDVMKPLVNEEVEFRDIIASPILDSYRNKVEFTIGYGIDDKPSVGFRIGSYKFGSCYVCRPEPGQLKIVPEVLATLAKSFEQYIRSTSANMKPFNQVTHDGNYRYLTCRINSAGEVIVIIGVFTGNLRQNVQLIETERKSLIAYFDEERRKELNIVGLLWHGLSFGPHSDCFAADFGLTSDPQLLFGRSYIQENLCGLKFKISTQSFFQINTPCTERLYSLVKEFAFEGEATSKPKLILDLCCGTGTIGLVLASGQAGAKVIGIELYSPAIEDAKENAELNDIPNERVSFICDKVEKALNGALARSEEAKGDDASVIAVLDPPRAGVHSSVIQTIRRTSAIKRLIYVSCNPASAFSNFQLLIADPSRRLIGEPFRLKCLVPVDLFPHTSHCELILVFER